MLIRRVTEVLRRGNRKDDVEHAISCDGSQCGGTENTLASTSKVVFGIHKTASISSQEARKMKRSTHIGYDQPSKDTCP
jgi:hypothetical protein